MPSRRTVIVSNRVASPDDKKAQAGGLAVALQDTLREFGGVWFGWSGKTVSQTAAAPTLEQVGPVTYATIDLTRKNYAEYYAGYANRTLWPLFHYRLDLASFSKQNYSGYLRVNDIFANELSKLLDGCDAIWVHDYHLIPLGERLRAAGCPLPMGFFLHTPFPAPEILTALPAHRALVGALCQYDLIGFQTDNDLRCFRDYIVHEVGGRILGDNLVQAFGRTFRAEAFPIGIEPDMFADIVRDRGHASRLRRIRRSRGGVEWVVGIDRLDYSKGLPERFSAFERFLERYPAYRGKVVLMQIAPPSRSEVPEYMEIRRQLETLAGHINGRFAEFDWMPVNYINRSYTREALAAFYATSRVGLVTPLRDGMNLIAKEYVAAQDPNNPGVLILSRFAGAARELDAALIVNPFDCDAVADAIAKGAEMGQAERIERWSAMMTVLRANTLTHWRDRFLAVLSEAPFGRKGP